VRAVTAAVHTWPPSTVLITVTLPIPGEDAAPPVRDVLMHLWGRMPGLVAQAREADRFVFSISFRTRNGEACELFVIQNIGAGTLLRTVARKLAQQVATAERRQAEACTATELTGPAAARVVDDLARLRAMPEVIEWRDPFEGVRA